MPVAVARKSRRPHPLIPAARACACGRPVAWIARPEGKRVLAETGVGCFLIFGGRNSAGELEPYGMTLREFQEKVSSIQLRDGRVLPVERILAFHPNHFATCRRARDGRFAGEPADIAASPAF